MSALRNRFTRQTAGYFATLAGCFAVATLAGFTSAADQVDNDAYDWMFRQNPAEAREPRSVVLAIDDASFSAFGGVRNLRTILADSLEKLAKARPKVTAIDVILADKGDPVEDARLERALAGTQNLVLATVPSPDGTWQNPRPEFRAHAAAIGQASADLQSGDGVTRRIPLAVADDHHHRYWALALEAFRMERGSAVPMESPDDIQVGGVLIPSRQRSKWPLSIRYVRDGIPVVSAKDLLSDAGVAGRFTDRVVFVGVYSSTAARDRVVTPLSVNGEHIPGIEVHAQAFETLERGEFLADADGTAVLVFCAIVAVLAGLIFSLLSGWPAYLLGACLLLAAHTAPVALFRQGIVFPYFTSVMSAWLTVTGAAIYQHFVVRRQLRRSEDERTRYRQAIHFVTHEMRTPLTAIQGSSELIGRYNLNDAKRKQIAEMINSESKRLARMIQTFLDVERLTDGQMDLKKDAFEVRDLMQSCIERVRPLADRKSIAIEVDGEFAGHLRGDRELMEFAIYNLLTNAVKYSAPDTRIAAASRPQGGEVRLSIEDQGMGMDVKELKKIFQRFYRTKQAEASGEQGSGIGLSIVDQIVRHHGGHLEVTSEPGRGSCFTVVVPTSVS